MNHKEFIEKQIPRGESNRKTGLEIGIKIYKEGQELYDHSKRQYQNFQDIMSFINEPTKGNALRIISKRILEYLYKVGGGPGTMIEAIYGEVLDKFIDFLYFYTKEMKVHEKISQLVAYGVEAKQNSNKGLSEILKKYKFDKSKYAQGPISYCVTLLLKYPEKQKEIMLLPSKLEEKVKKNVKSFDEDIIYFLAVDSFIRSIEPAVKEIKKILVDPTNVFENGFRVLNLSVISKDEWVIQSLNFKTGLGPEIDKYIKLRNSWAQWASLPAMTLGKYQKAVLPNLNFE